MKKTALKINTMAILFAILFSTSCKKETSPDVTHTNGSGNNNEPTTTHTSASSFLKSVAPEMQKFTINAATGGTITGKAGTSINIKSGSLMLDGLPVTGNIDITLREIRTKGDMMSSGVFTGTTDGQILESDGMFFINATKDGVQLQLNAKNPLDITMPAVDNLTDENMELFKGVPDNNGNIVWENINDTINEDSLRNISNAYVFKWYNFGFCNIDAYYDANCSQDLEITIPESYDPTYTSIMIIFEDVHAEASTYLFSGKKFKTPYCLPLNKKIKILCVTIKDKKLYYSLTDHNTETTMRYTLPEGTLASEEALEDLLKSF